MKKDMTVLKAVIKADYERHVKKFEKLKAGKDIVFVGDSMIAYFPTKVFGIDEKVYNLGIPGDTTVGVLNRINQISKVRPKRIILNIGLNDFVLTDLSHKETLNNILDIRHQLLEDCPNAKVYIVSLTPINQKNFQDQTYLLNRDPKDAIALNQMLKEKINDDFIDIYATLLDEEGSLNIEYTKDGIHLNQKGYDIYYRHIKKYISDEDKNAQE